MDLQTHTRRLEAAGAVPFAGIEQLDEANRRLGWSIEYRQLAKGRATALFRTVEMERGSLTGEQFSTRTHVLARSPRGSISLVIPLTGFSECRVLGDALREGDVMLFPAGSATDIFTGGAAGDLTVGFSESDYRDSAGSLFPAARIPLFSSRVVKAHPGQLRTLSDDISRGLVEGHVDAEAASVLLARCVALIVESLDDRTEEKLLTNDAAALVTRRAREYVESRFTKTIRIEELCRHAKVGIRTLQRAFLAEIGATPTQYIKATRLNAARRQLLAVDPCEDSVTDIARRCGFTHLGRFSVEYRTFFGESPSSTLRR